MQTVTTTCCIVGGGPAGIMLGYLLARAGVKVTVLEKHADFFRDFRGDTIHPATAEILAELGLLEVFLKLPHDEMPVARVSVNRKLIPLADFSALPTRCKFMSFVPQWDFLEFLSEHAKKYPTFDLRMQHEATDLLQEGGRIVGVRAETPDGPVEVRADLVVAADGRHSVSREKAGLPLQTFGVPIDVLWMRIPKPPDHPPSTLFFFNHGQFVVLIDRTDYYQCGYLIPKGEFPAIQEHGLDALHSLIVAAVPFLKDTVEDIDSWDKVHLLTVRIDRLTSWHKPGLLFVGDAAHAMSPAGGVGINLAIQDAVATANALAEKLRDGKVTDADLAAIQARREKPARTIQDFQVQLHKQIINAKPGNMWRVGLLFSIVRLLPFISKRLAEFVAIGPLPEHVQTPDRSFTA